MAPCLPLRNKPQVEGRTLHLGSLTCWTTLRVLSWAMANVWHGMCMLCMVLIRHTSMMEHIFWGQWVQAVHVVVCMAHLLQQALKSTVVVQTSGAGVASHSVGQRWPSLAACLCRFPAVSHDAADSQGPSGCSLPDLQDCYPAVAQAETRHHADWLWG